MKFIKNLNQVDALQYDGSQTCIFGCEIDKKGRIFLTHNSYDTIQPGVWVYCDGAGVVNLMSDQYFKHLYVPVPENPKWEDD